MLAAVALFFIYAPVERLHLGDSSARFKTEGELRVARIDERVFSDRSLRLATPKDDVLLVDTSNGQFLSYRSHQKREQPGGQSGNGTAPGQAQASVVGIPQRLLDDCSAPDGDLLTRRFVTSEQGRHFLVCKKLRRPHMLLIGAWHTDAIMQTHRVFRRLLLLVGGIAFLFVLLFANAIFGALIVHPLKRLERETTAEVSAFDEAWEDVTRPVVRNLRVLSVALNVIGARRAEEKESFERQRVQLRRIDRELEMTQRNLVQSGKLATVGELSAGIAHEIGNPLGVIQGYLSVLERTDLSEEERRSILATLDESFARIKRIVKDLLNFSRPMSDEIERSELGEVIRELWRFLEAQKRFRNIRLDFVLEREPLYVGIAESRLHQIVMNLFLNASDAMGGSGRIEIRATTVQGKVRIRVKDHGVGIPVEEVDNIFRPFYSTKGVRGTGLGLTISHYLAGQHGGDIEVESVPGKGTTFVLTFNEVNERGERPESLSSAAIEKPDEISDDDTRDQPEELAAPSASERAAPTDADRRET